MKMKTFTTTLTHEGKMFGIGVLRESRENIEQGFRGINVNILFVKSAIPSNHLFERAIGLHAQQRHLSVRWPFHILPLNSNSFPA
jgi:hypothetical protein